MTQIRPAAVGGVFYPGNAAVLDREVRQYLKAATGTPAPPPKALIVPHAGYIYSGLVAAYAYRLLEGAADIERVVLLGPSHRVPVQGLAVPEADAFETPAGTVPVDRETVKRLLRLPQVVVNGAAHAYEHSLEVQLPFLQHQLGVFRLVPLVVGDATADEVAEVLEAAWGGDETLIVISTDLSHYLSYDVARQVDEGTAKAILALEAGEIGHERACGATPLWGLLTVARRRALRVELLDLRNSGDTEGDRDRVVGYGAFALREAARAGGGAP